MKKSLPFLLLCGVFLTACASRATYHEYVPQAASDESIISEPTAEIPLHSAESAETVAETAVPTAEPAAPTAETAELSFSTEEASTSETSTAEAEHGNPGQEPGVAFEFNGTGYIFELPVCLAVMSQDGRIIEWRGNDIHSMYINNLVDVSRFAALNEFSSGKWYFSADGMLLLFRQITQEEYDSLTGYGLDCPPDNEYLLNYDVSEIYNVMFYAPYAD